MVVATPPVAALDMAIGGARFDVPASSLKEMRFRTTMRQQYDFSCGSAAVATLLTYHYGQRFTEQQVFEQMYARGDQARIRREGFSLLDMQAFLAAHGYRADGFQLPLEKLSEAGLPAIVLLSDKGYQHFVVVKGIAGDRVLLGDPARGTRALTRAAFHAAWVGKLLFVIHGDTHAGSFNASAEWRTAPAAPLAAVFARDGLGAATMAKLGPGDF
ncbi:hypothetical protein SAMN05428948_3221 [Massilia sp. CF038]|nr:hypothetical protein SAMN05428948_3221 [Massilia sp. CF038]